LSHSRNEDAEAAEELGSENINARKHPVRRIGRPGIETLFREQESADRKVRLITSDNRPAVDASENCTSSNPVHGPESEKGGPEQRWERAAHIADDATPTRIYRSRSSELMSSPVDVRLTLPFTRAAGRRLERLVRLHGSVKEGADRRRHDAQRCVETEWKPGHTGNAKQRNPFQGL